MTDSTPTSPNHPTVDLPAMLEGPRLPTRFGRLELAQALELEALEDVRQTLDDPSFPGRPA